MAEQVAVQRVGSVADFADRKSKVFNTKYNGKPIQIAVYHLDGHFYAIDNLCSHKQAMLTEGDIEDLGKAIPESGGFCARCPKHRGKFAGGLYFSVSNGKVFTKSPCSAKQFDPNWKLSTYDVTVKDDEVWVNPIPSNGVEPTEDPDSKFWARITLANTEKYNHDSFIYTFTLDDYAKIDYLTAPDKKKFKKLFKGRMKLNKKLGETPIQCWHLDLQDEEGKVIREYTPISTWADLKNSSKLVLLIKLYDDGQMSQVLAKSQNGTKFFIGPPKETIPSSFFLGVTDQVTYGCIAGGTGITPIYQMIQYIESKLTASEKAPKLTLIYSNKKAEDILMKETLTNIEKKWPGHFKVIHTLTRDDPKNHDPQCGYLFGRVNSEMIEKYIPSSSHQHVFVSGPEGMWSTLLPLLKQQGYPKASCTELEA